LQSKAIAIEMICAGLCATSASNGRLEARALSGQGVTVRDGPNDGRGLTFSVHGHGTASALWLTNNISNEKEQRLLPVLQLNAEMQLDSSSKGRPVESAK